ncbi:hypothetical protein [Polaromonas sp.]|uniref:hypothetical protein n=1 Tax=Polaromonas sp. TaxID=1869339 RepID=UPI00352B4DD8
MTHPHLSTEQYLSAVRADIVLAARRLEAREGAFLEGVRKLASLRHAVSREEHDEAFMLFVAIDSESDHIPGPAMRALCSATWLEECDSEAKRIEAFYGHDVDVACQQLVELFEDNASQRRSAEIRRYEP